MNSRDSRLLRLARRYVWGSLPERTVPDKLPRLVAQVMELGTWSDKHKIIDLLGRDSVVEVLRSPPPGILSAKSWTFWHFRLGLGEAPDVPRGRRLPAEEAAHAAQA